MSRVQPLVNKYLLVPASAKIVNVQNFLRRKLHLKSDTQVKEILWLHTTHAGEAGIVLIVSVCVNYWPEINRAL